MITSSFGLRYFDRPKSVKINEVESPLVRSISLYPLQLSNFRINLMFKSNDEAFTIFTVVLLRVSQPFMEENSLEYQSDLQVTIETRTV